LGPIPIPHTYEFDAIHVRVTAVSETILREMTTILFTFILLVRNSIVIISDIFCHHLHVNLWLQLNNMWA